MPEGEQKRKPTKEIENGKKRFKIRRVINGQFLSEYKAVRLTVLPSIANNGVRNNL